MKPIPFADVLIFMSSISCLLYLYRSPYRASESIYSLLRLVSLYLSQYTTPSNDLYGGREDPSNAMRKAFLNINWKKRKKNPIWRKSVHLWRLLMHFYFTALSWVHMNKSATLPILHEVIHLLKYFPSQKKPLWAKNRQVFCTSLWLCTVSLLKLLKCTWKVSVLAKIVPIQMAACTIV